MKWYRSILFRLISLHVLAIVIVGGAIPLTLYKLLSSTADELHHRALRETADEIAHYLKPSPRGTWELNFPPDVRNLYAHSYGQYEFAIVDETGQVLFSSDNAGAAVYPSDQLRPTPAFFQLLWKSRLLYGGSIPEQIRGKRVWIQVAQDLNHRDVLIDDIVAAFPEQVGWVIALVLLLLLAIDVVIFRRALRPVLQASKMAEAIGPARIDLRLPTDQMPREILPLVVAINSALDRLERAYKAQADFVADAAHELRTPLTILRARIDTLSDQEVAKALRGSVDVMTQLVGQLLETAELDALAVGLDETADLHSVCAEVVAFLAPLAIADGKDIALISDANSVLIRGNRDALFHAIVNLAQNAVRHTSQGTVVEVSVNRNATVQVTDHGPGIPDSEREIIFRRFWRRDRRRPGSAGLGLSIVEQIVTAHEAKISVANGSDGGAVFTIEFKRMDAITSSYSPAR